ncbi:MAG: DUF2442 domain-containing protein [Bdellovibrio sp.]|nr:DUF2442 domain-containing protein [Bdellovibrio sp.]
MSQTASKINFSDLAISKVSINDEMITAEINDGRVVAIPLSWFPRLISATPEQRSTFEITPSGYGIHWPHIDEDISIKSFIS